nr:hypothetical protein [Mesorhizobium sp.]
MIAAADISPELLHALTAQLGMPPDGVKHAIDRLADPYWRLRNIYWVANKEGHPELFQPWPEQEKFLDEIWFRNVIPKARQRGFSTVVQLLMLDACLFTPNTNAAVIAQDEASALKIFDTKIKFAWLRRPPIVHAMLGPPVRDAELLFLRHELLDVRELLFAVDLLGEAQIVEEA